jgi:hypothetical protein
MQLRLLGAASAALLMAVGITRADNIGVRVNGERVDFPAAQPTQIAGRVMIPLRGVLQRLGADRVQWRPERQEVLVSGTAGDMRLRIGDRVAVVNGRPVELDVPPMVIQDTTMVPLRFVSENLGAKVDWLPATQTVYIVTTGERVAGARERFPANRNADDRNPVAPRRDRYADQDRYAREREPVPRRGDRLDQEPTLRSTYLAALYPRPGAMVNDPRVEISVRFRPRAAVDLESVRLYVNDRDVTRDAQITATGIRYVPTRDLPQGRNDVRLTFRDGRGVQASQAWDFSIR